jgi:hypothetical protein
MAIWRGPRQYMHVRTVPDIAVAKGLPDRIGGLVGVVARQIGGRIAKEVFGAVLQLKAKYVALVTAVMIDPPW